MSETLESLEYDVVMDFKKKQIIKPTFLCNLLYMEWSYRLKCVTVLRSCLQRKFGNFGTNVPVM